MCWKIFKYLQVISSLCEVILELGESETNVKYEVAWPKAVHHCIHGLVLWYLLSLSSLAEDFRDLLVLSQSKQILAIWRFLALSHKTAGWPNKASGQHKAAPTGASQCLTFKSWKSMSGAKVAKVKRLVCGMLGVVCEVTRDATGYSGDSSFNVLWCKVMHFTFESSFTLCACAFLRGNPTLVHDSLHSQGYDFNSLLSFCLFCLPLLLSGMHPRQMNLSVHTCMQLHIYIYWWLKLVVYIYIHECSLSRYYINMYTWARCVLTFTCSFT